MSSEQDGNDRATEAGDQGGASSFDDIVASWRAEGTVPDWPTAPTAVEPPAPVAPTRPGPAVDPLRESDEHYVPPEPPPLPRLGAAAVVGLALVAIGIVLIAAPQWLGMSSLYGLPLGLVAIAGGLTWLLMRLWQPTPEDDPYSEDDGTV
ncbi:hypothetical protein [Pseudonocardia xishanensis]|uniref:DUF308 domain-containing protein n=1 Tax=Pseudonocardia xishanensis TaxID=630995 RepID=A0ABP8RRZ0_9PSEU